MILALAFVLFADVSEAFKELHNDVPHALLDRTTFVHGRPAS